MANKEGVYYVGDKVFSDSQSAAAYLRTLKARGYTAEQIKAMSLKTKAAAETLKKVSTFTTAAATAGAIPKQVSATIAASYNTLKPQTLPKEQIVKSITTAPPAKSSTTSTSTKTAVSAVTDPLKGVTDYVSTAIKNLTKQTDDVQKQIQDQIAAQIEAAQAAAGNLSKQLADSFAGANAQSVSLLDSLSGAIGQSFGPNVACPGNLIDAAAPQVTPATSTPDITTRRTPGPNATSRFLGEMRNGGLIVLLLVTGGIVATIAVVGRKGKAMRRRNY